MNDEKPIQLRLTPRSTVEAQCPRCGIWTGTYTITSVTLPGEPTEPRGITFYCTCGMVTGRIEPDTEIAAAHAALLLDLIATLVPAKPEAEASTAVWDAAPPIPGDGTAALERPLNKTYATVGMTVEQIRLWPYIRIPIWSKDQRWHRVSEICNEDLELATKTLGTYVSHKLPNGNEICDLCFPNSTVVAGKAEPAEPAERPLNRPYWPVAWPTVGLWPAVGVWSPILTDAGLNRGPERIKAPGPASYMVPAKDIAPWEIVAWRYIMEPTGDAPTGLALWHRTEKHSQAMLAALATRTDTRLSNALPDDARLCAYCFGKPRETAVLNALESLRVIPQSAAESFAKAFGAAHDTPFGAQRGINIRTGSFAATPPIDVTPQGEDEDRDEGDENLTYSITLTKLRLAIQKLAHGADRPEACIACGYNADAIWEALGFD